MTHAILVLPLLFGLGQSPQTPAASVAPVKSSVEIQYVVAEKKEESDPGKDITDDPHGPGTHGRDPHEEIHDKGMPANNLDPYGNKKD